jgi:hypothetical protein
VCGSRKSDLDIHGRMEGMHMRKDTGTPQLLDHLSPEQYPALIDSHRLILALRCPPCRGIPYRDECLWPVIRLPARRPF